MDDAAIMQRIAELGLTLPPPPKAVAAYAPVKIAGELAYVAGQVPKQDDRLMHPGHLGNQVRIEDASEAAAQAALQALSALRAALGGFDRLQGITQVNVYIAATPDFIDHPTVANGASELLAAVLGEPGQHARVAIGVASLPLGTCVEVQVTAEIEPI